MRYIFVCHNVGIFTIFDKKTKAKFFSIWQITIHIKKIPHVGLYINNSKSHCGGFTQEYTLVRKNFRRIWLR